jgi:hypothetical protein
MNENARRSPGRLRRTGQRRAAGLLTALLAGTALLTALLAGTALLTAACGSGSPAAGTSTTHQKSVAFAQCVRSHGDPGFPDPDSQGTFDVSQIDLNSPLVQAAINACQKLIPPGAVQLAPSQQRALTTQALKFTVCMRARGYPNFPDPVIGNGRVEYRVGPPMGIDPYSPQLQAAQQLCQKLNPLPGAGGGS